MYQDKPVEIDSVQLEYLEKNDDILWALKDTAGVGSIEELQRWVFEAREFTDKYDKEWDRFYNGY